MERKEDFFDRLLRVSFIRPFAPFLARHRKMLLYLFFGGLTTVVSIGTFWVLLPFAHPLLVNIASWVAAVVFAFFTNRTWVFPSSADGKGVLKEAASFFGGRLFTLGVEEVALYGGITLLMLPPMAVKLLTQLLVLLLNYLISRWVVFKG